MRTVREPWRIDEFQGVFFRGEEVADNLLPLLRADFAVFEQQLIIVVCGKMLVAEVHIADGKALVAVRPIAFRRIVHKPKPEVYATLVKPHIVENFGIEHIAVLVHAVRFRIFIEHFKRAYIVVRIDKLCRDADKTVGGGVEFQCFCHKIIFRKALKRPPWQRCSPYCSNGSGR